MSRGKSPPFIDIDRLESSLRQKTHAFNKEIAIPISRDPENLIGNILQSFNLSATTNQDYQVSMWALTLAAEKSNPARVTEYQIRDKIKTLFDKQIVFFTESNEQTSALSRIQAIIRHQDIANAFMKLEIDLLNPEEYLSLKKQFLERLEAICDLKIKTNQESNLWNEETIQKFLTTPSFLTEASDLTNKELVSLINQERSSIFQQGHQINPTQTGIAAAFARHGSRHSMTSSSSSTPPTETRNSPITTPSSPIIDDDEIPRSNPSLKK